MRPHFHSHHHPGIGDVLEKGHGSEQELRGRPALQKGFVDSGTSAAMAASTAMAATSATMRKMDSVAATGERARPPLLLTSGVGTSLNTEPVIIGKSGFLKS